MGTADPGPAKPGQDAPSVPGAGEGDPASVGGWALWCRGGQDEEDVPRLVVPPSTATLATTCTLPTQEPSSS